MPLNMALDVDACLQLCAEYFPVSTPLRNNMSLIHRAIVDGSGRWWDLEIVMKKALSPERVFLSSKNYHVNLTGHNVGSSGYALKVIGSVVAFGCVCFRASSKVKVSSWLKLNFHDQPPESREPFEYPRNETDFQTIDNEVKKLLKKGVVEHSQRETGEYFSNLFISFNKDPLITFNQKWDHRFYHFFALGTGQNLAAHYPGK